MPITVLLLLLLQDTGKQEFTARCAACHGARGHGGERGPAIVLRGRSDGDLRDLIRTGFPSAGMPGFDIPDAQLAPLIAFVRSTAAALEEPAASTELRERRSVSSAEILQPKLGDWPTYHGRLGGNRHSPLRQIDAGNVASLTAKWMFPIRGSDHLEGTPVVVDGVMYVTSVNEAFALDARNGRQIWHYRRPRSKGLVGDASGGINRGVAILGDRIFLVTDNAHLIALDRITGRLVWDVEMADSKQNYGATSAPLVVKDLVISGHSGGDEGVRGFLAAYKASTGERVWRFWTVPAPGDPVAKTWDGKALAHGCASPWLTGTYDPETDLLFWPTGNPCPDYNESERKGDNLYSDSCWR
jgi:alcohol dehydrogenase (cytochrome c)